MHYWPNHISDFYDSRPFLSTIVKWFKKKWADWNKSMSEPPYKFIPHVHNGITYYELKIKPMFTTGWL